jgi:putative ABC transport system permease protein
MLTESGVLAAAGGLLGLVLGWVGTRTVLAMQPDGLPRLEAVGVDGNVLLFTAALSLVAACVFGAAPALRAGRANLADALKDRGSDAGGARSNKVRTALVVVEVALSLVLLIGAGLMLRSFTKLQEVHPGFETDDVLTLKVPLPFFKYNQPDGRVSFFERLRQRLEALPGVEAVGGATPLPLGGGDQYWVQPYGRDNATEEEWASNRADYRAVVPGYTEAMGIQLRAGRTLVEADNQAGALPVVVVDEKLAALTWPDEDPVGKAMQIVRFDFEDMKMQRVPVQVVGVVRHVRSESLRSDGRGAIYYPYRFFPWWPMSLAVKAASDPSALTSAIRQEVSALDGDVPIADVRLMEEYVDDATAPTRFTLTLVSVFAGLALVLSAVGLYGVISYSLRQRFQEFGVRMAFGAGSRNIVRMVLSHGLVLALSGVVLGLVTALALTRTASSLLFGVSPMDPVTFAGIPVLLVGVTALASYIPARRATRIDPVNALRGRSRADR